MSNQDGGQPNYLRSRNLVQGLGSLTAQSLGTGSLGFLFQFALLRLLSPTQYGVYSGIVVATTIATMCASFGLNQTAARFLAFWRDQDEQKSWVAIRKILYLTLSFTVIVTVVYSVLTADLSLYFAKTTEWTTVFLFSGIWLFLAPISSFCQGIIQGLRRYSLLATILFISRVIMVIFTVVALLFERSLIITMVSWIIYTSIIVSWSFALTGNKLRRSHGQFSYSEIMRYSYPLGVASVITIVSTTADLVVVGGYLGVISLAVYNAAVTISTILNAILVLPLITTLLPELSITGNKLDISRGVRLAVRFAMLAILPASLLVVVISRQLIDLFTSGGIYLLGLQSLQLIASSYLFVGIQMILVTLFQAVGKTVYAMIVGVTTALIDIGLSILLVPRLGIEGAAFAKVSVALTGVVLGVLLAKEYVSKLDNRGFYLKGVVAAIIPFGATFAISSYVSTRTLTIVPYSAVFVVIFLACVKSLKLLSQEDKSFIGHILPVFMRKLVDFL